MKRIALLALIVLALSCKNDNKKENQLEENNSNRVATYNIVKTFDAQDLITWTKTRVELEKTNNEIEGGINSFILKRTSKDESCYLSTSLIPVEYNSTYKVTLNVKKGANSNHFGLRMAGSYPDRVDAFFNIEEGKLLETKTSRDFEEAQADIQDLGNGWFQCTVEAKVASDNVRVIMGPSSIEKNVLGWEGKTDNSGDVIFDPSSLKVEEKTY